ncbi:MAG: heat-inducible transcriptional repressor HrcA [Alphaproteobacteria bacterium]|nr:MAG: heat-inducible transcriptional repressor HrcA [Alphaproteobacteria bacterium]
MIRELNERTRQVLKLVVDAYVETGEPVGSMAISQKLGMKLSPATIRSAMAELEDLGLLYSPHTSAGRLPTDTGLTVFVDGLLEIDSLSPDERRLIDQKMASVRGGSLTDILEQTSTFLSGLSSCAGLVFAPKTDDPVKQIEFVLLAPGRALAVLVTNSGIVENRLLEVPADVTATSLTRAANYLNSRIAEKTLQQAADYVTAELARDKTQLDALTAKVVASGIASLAPKDAGGHLFVKGQANLLEDVTAIEDLERIRMLFEALETKETMLNLLQATASGEGVKIFIGAENKLFSHSGCSLIVSPYKSQDARIAGAIGVIGPTRLNYGRVIPVVNYTSQIISKIIG